MPNIVILSRRHEMRRGTGNIRVPPADGTTFHLGMLEGAIGLARSSRYLSSSFFILFHEGWGWEGTKEDVNSRHVSLRRRRYPRQSTWVERFDELRGNPQRPTFPTPIAAKAIDLLRVQGMFSRNFMRTTQKCRNQKKENGKRSLRAFFDFSFNN